MSPAFLKRSLALVVLLAVGFAAASAAWTVRTKPCRDFETRVRTVALSLPKDRPRTETEQAEVVRLLEQACLSDLQRCNFRVCSDRSTLALLSSARKKQQDLPPSPPPPAAQTEPPALPPPQSPTAPSLPPSLQWLEKNLSCDSFLREIQDRYPSIDRFTELAPETQSELKTILRVACSKRFQQCRFAACTVTDSVSRPASP